MVQIKRWLYLVSESVTWQDVEPSVGLSWHVHMHLLSFLFSKSHSVMPYVWQHQAECSWLNLQTITSTVLQNACMLTICDNIMHCKERYMCVMKSNILQCVIWILGNFAVIKQGGVGGNEYYTVWSVQPPLFFYVSNSLSLSLSHAAVASSGLLANQIRC